MFEVRFESPFGEWCMRHTAPPPDLAACVAGFWETRGVVGYGYEKLLPSGNADFMVNLGPPQQLLRSASDPDPDTFRDAWLSGIQDRPLLTAPAHGNELFETHFVAASLRPAGVPELFGVDAVESAGQVIDAQSMIGSGVRSLRDSLGDLTTTAARFGLLARFLRQQKARFSRPAPFAAIWAAGQTLSSHGNVRIEDLCGSLGVSRKHLNHLYRLAVGLTPKTYARLTRFRSVIARIDDPASAWADVAANRGYFDQAHLIRDFKRFAGESPTSFLRNRAPDGESVNYADRDADAR